MIDALRHFLLVVEHGTFTEAARRAHLSQPALSASLQKLEAHFGTRLLHRGRSGSSVTAAGEALVPRARAVFATITEAERAVREVAGLHAGEVHLGAGATICTYLLPPYLTRFRAMYPGITIRLREGTAAELDDALAEGAIDMALIASREGELWQRDELILVGPPGSEATEVSGALFVTFPRGASTRDLLDKHFAGAEVAMELSSIATVKAHVRAGMGIALLSRVAVENDLALGRLVEIPNARTPIARALRLKHRGVDRLPPAAAALRELLRAAPTPAEAPRKKPRPRGI